MTTLTLDPRLVIAAPGGVRTWLVELRKLVDTRAGLALLITGAVLTGVFGGGLMLYRDGVALTDLATMAGVPGGILAAVASVLLVAGERSHRTALSTYALTARRGRVVAAKAAACATLAVAVTLLAIAAAAIVAIVGTAITGKDVSWTLDGRVLVAFTATNAVLALAGWALAYLCGNAPAPLVILLVWPMLTGLIAQAGPAAAEVLTWIDQGAAVRLAADTTPTDLARITTSILVWVAVPATVGIVRELRAEVR